MIGYELNGARVDITGGTHRHQHHFVDASVFMESVQGGGDVRPSSVDEPARVHVKDLLFLRPSREPVHPVTQLVEHAMAHISEDAASLLACDEAVWGALRSSRER